MSKIRRPLTRRDFLKMGAVALGGAALACGRSEDLVEIKATLTPSLPDSDGAANQDPTTPPSDPGTPADAILVNGNLITIDPAVPTAEALAIQGGLIAEVGTNSKIQARVGEATRVIDLGGKTLTPGLIDAHNHLQVWGTLLGMFVALNPPEVRTLDDLLSVLAAEVAQKQEGEWVQGYYWYVDRLPTRADLDPISPDNPIWLMQQGGHFGNANSKALEFSGITSAIEDPPGGIFERDAKGELNGIVYNHRAMDMIRVHAPQPSVEMMMNNIHFAEELMAGMGVTTFQDCNARFSAVEAYLEAGRTHSMMLRGEVFYTLEWPADLERALTQIQYEPDDFMRFAGYKFLIDGQYPTWFTHEPHPGIRWNTPTWDPDQFKLAIRKLHDTGLQVTVHCGGDASVDLVLDAYEEAMNANPRPDPRHRIEHATLTKPHSTQRMADLGVQISCQPQFVRFNQHIEEIFGAKRAARIKVTREWLDAGVNVALGSDTPTSPWQSPVVTLFEAVMRLGFDDKPFHPEQAITIQEALYAHTMGSAHAAFEEKTRGSLTPGKMADLVVWSDDFYSINPLDILNVKAEMTMVGGNIVHEA